MKSRFLLTLASIFCTTLFAAQQVITPGAGVTGAQGRDIINSNFTEIYNRTLPASAESGVVWVSKSTTATDTRTGLLLTDPAHPFATIKAAYTAAVASGILPMQVRILPGEYAETQNLPLTSNNISIIGSGEDQTLITYTGTNRMDIQAQDVTIAGLTLSKSDNPNPVLSTSVVGLASFFPNVIVKDVTCINTAITGEATGIWPADLHPVGGVAIGTFSGIGINLTVRDSDYGIAWNYGGRLENPDIVCRKRAIYHSQSVAFQQSNPYAIRHEADIYGGQLAVTDYNGGCVIRGLIENSVGSRGLGDGNGDSIRGMGPSWSATQLHGTKVLGATAITGTAQGTSVMVRGCLHLSAAVLEGDRVTDFTDSSYWKGCRISCQNSAVTSVIANMHGSFVTGGEFVNSCPQQVIHMQDCTWSGVAHEGDAEVAFGSNLYQLISNTTYSATVHTSYLIGWQNRNLALLCKTTAGVLPDQTFVQVLPTPAAPLTVFQLATMTVEGWVKLPSTTTNTGIICQTATTGRNGFFIYCQRGTTKLVGGFNTTANGEMSSTDCYTLFNSGDTIASLGIGVPAVVNLTNNHNIPTSGKATVTIAGVTGGTYTGAAINGIHIVTATDANSFTVDDTNCAVPGTGGTVTLNGPFGDGWHHVAIRRDAGSETLLLDGVIKATSAAAVNPVCDGRLVIGGFTDAATDAGLGSFDGQGSMFANFRISNVVRTISATTLQKTYAPDANTLALWSEQTDGPLRWADKMGRFPAVFHGNEDTYPYFVPAFYAP